MTANPNASDNTKGVLARIRSMIDTGELQDNRLPTERELSARFGTGRRATRNALEALEAEGLIWRRQGKGTFVGPAPDPAEALVAEIAPDADLLTVMEARICLEPGLAELCARRASAEDVDQLRLLARRATTSADTNATELWDGALHRLIARIADNRLLSTAFTLLDEVRKSEKWQHQRQRARSPERLTLYECQHGDIIDAIEARDGPKARQAMLEHLLVLAEALKRSLEQDAE